MRYILILGFILFIVGCTTIQDNSYKLDLLQPGMTFEEVQNVVGKFYYNQISRDSYGYSTFDCGFHGESSFLLFFRDDKLVSWTKYRSPYSY